MQGQREETTFPECLLPAQHFTPPPPPAQGLIPLIDKNPEAQRGKAKRPLLKAIQLGLHGQGRAGTGRDAHRAPGKGLTLGRVQVRGRSGKSHGVVGGGFCPFSAGTSGCGPTSSASPSGCKDLHRLSETGGCLQGRDAKQVYKDHARWPLPRSPEHRRTSTASSEESFKPECT